MRHFVLKKLLLLLETMLNPVSARRRRSQIAQITREAV